MDPLDLVRAEVRALPVADPKAAPDRAIRMDANEGRNPPSPRLRAAFARALRAAALHRYPHPSALPLREVFADRFGLHPDEVIAGNGSSECLNVLLTALGSRGSWPVGVLVPWPSFYIYRIGAVANGLSPILVPLDERFDLDAAAIDRALRRHRPRLILFATPNNPTGNRFDARVVDRVIARGDCLVALDEAYGEFCGQNSLRRIRTAENLVVLRSMSKMGLAGLRVGFLAANRRLARAIDRARPPYNLSVVAQRCAAAALRAYPTLLAAARAVAADRDRLAGAIARIPGFTVYPSDANFLLVRSARASGSVVRALTRRRIWVRDLSEPGPLERCFRVTVGTPAENREFLGALAGIAKNP